MTPTASRIAPAKPLATTGITWVAARAIRRITWKVLAATLAIAVTLHACFSLDLGWHSSRGAPTIEMHLAVAIINVAISVAIMIATLIADEAVSRGARRLFAYASAVVAGCAVGSLVQWGLLRALGVRMLQEHFGDPAEVVAMQPAAVFFEYLIWASIIVFIYVNRRTELAAAARMNAAQVERANTQRRTLESKLQALQARVEPQFLFNSLVKAHQLYETSAVLGNAMLDDLIVYLRTALPHLRDTTSTLDKEISLVAAYVGIVRAGTDARYNFAADASATALASSVPAMLLLPLADQFVSCAGADRPAPIHVRAETSDGVLRIELSGAGLDIARFNSIGHDIRERLAALYGDRATLANEMANGGTRLVMEIPHEPAHSNHR